MPIPKTYVTQKGESFQGDTKKTKLIIESELSRVISGIDDLRLHKKIGYALLSQGKRLRPLMAILSAQCVGGNQEDVMSLALAFEMLHTATLVHDDILDREKIRRGVLTIHEKWSLNDAILVGDALISLAIGLAAVYGSKILKIVSETGLVLCDGEYIDVSSTSMKSSENEYLEKIRKKSASLFKATTQCGAKVGGGSDLEVRCLADFGEHFGMAYQLSDDLSDMTSLNDGIPKDLRTRRISLPLIHLYHNSIPVERERLLNDLRIINRKNSVPAYALEKILRNLKTKGSIDYCRHKINEYVHKSTMDIQSFKDNKFKYHLIQMAKSLIPQ